MRKILLTRLGLTAAGVLATAIAWSAPALALDHVKFNMAWIAQGSTIGPVIAEQKGFFKQLDLSVETVRGYGGTRTTNEIDQGLFEFGYGNPLAIVLNRADGGKTRMVGAINDAWPGGLCFVTSRHRIAGPKDMKGLTIGGGANSPVQLMVPAWLQRNGLPRDWAKLMQLDPNVIYASLIEGKIDMAECWKGSDKANIDQLARDASLNVGWVEYAKFNLDIYGSGLVTTDKMIAERPDVVRRFVKGTYQGYAYAFDHPDEAVDILLKVFPVTDRRVVLQQLLETKELITGPDTAAHGFGWMREDKMKRTLDFIAEAYSLHQPVQVGDIYTDAFLGK